MNHRKYILPLFILLTGFIPASSQSVHPKDYFRAPLDIPVYLSGNFGEIRSGHFHAGLDMKTAGVEGKIVYAAADGYVSRIKISPFGYGKALYITHANGNTTVYGHLQRFYGKIAEYVKKAQYSKESFAIELFPNPHQLLVQKSDTVAISGNSGGSGGPHLHFEIRDTKSETPLNPLLFGFKIKDNIKPIIKHISVYPLNDSSSVNASDEPIYIKASGSDGKYKISLKEKIKVFGDIGFGIEAIDNLNGTSNRNGVYSIELMVDSVRKYYHEMERIAFYETRFINSHVDFLDWKMNKRRVQKSWLQPNNQLSIYKELVNRGIILFKDDTSHAVKYVIKDAYGNTSSLEFQVQSDPPLEAIDSPESDSTKQYTSFFKYDKFNSFNTDNIIISMPSKILYEDIKFQYTIGDTMFGAITPTHYIHDLYVPLHSHMTISIKVDSLNPELNNKAVIVALNNKGKVIASEGGKFEGGFITVKTRSLGPYTVMLDTIPPKISPENISKGQDMTTHGSLVVKIADNLSGIKKYRGTIDGQWILMDYNPKKAKLTYIFDQERITKGKHVFKLYVADERGNENSWEAEFTN